MSESSRIWDLLQRAYAGNVWHGPALRELLESLTAEQAAAHAVRGAPTIWETTVHVSLHEDLARRRLQGEALPELSHAESWPAPRDTSRAAWRAALAAFEEGHERLRQAVWDFQDARLEDVVPGRDYPFYLLLHGVVQHELYHAGQIVVLMQAQGLAPRG